MCSFVGYRAWGESSPIRTPSSSSSSSSSSPWLNYNICRNILRYFLSLGGLDNQQLQPNLKNIDSLPKTYPQPTSSTFLDQPTKFKFAFAFLPSLQSFFFSFLYVHCGLVSKLLIIVNRRRRRHRRHPLIIWTTELAEMQAGDDLAFDTCIDNNNKLMPMTRNNYHLGSRISYRLHISMHRRAGRADEGDNMQWLCNFIKLLLCRVIQRCEDDEMTKVINRVEVRRMMINDTWWGGWWWFGLYFLPRNGIEWDAIDTSTSAHLGMKGVLLNVRLMAKISTFLIIFRVWECILKFWKSNL